MFPIICKIGPLTVYSYGLMLAIAVICCSLLLSKEAHSRGISSDLIFDFVFWTVLVGLFGARLFYIILNIKDYVANPVEIIMFQHGGLAIQGGIIFGFGSAIFFVKKHKLQLAEFLDLIAPYLALGEAIGRIGCFLNGCCYGRHFKYGIYFPVYHDTLYPTQLFSTVCLLIIFLILKRLQKSKLSAGRIFAAYIILAASYRFLIEFFRADHQWLFLNLSIFQIISLFFILCGIIFLKKSCR